MNLKGSYKALLDNSKAAMLAAIEIYNKPQMIYRDECFSILLVNAWELLLKAVLSKNKERIFYQKERNKPYRTFTIQDTLSRAKNFFPANIQYDPTARNIEMIVTYRNNVIHFYNQKNFSIIIYGLAQTSIMNYRDLIFSIFNIDIANEMTIKLLPLSFGAQPDPITFMQTTRSKTANKAVAQFLKELSVAAENLESQNFNTSRFLTVFKIHFESVKKLSSADIIVGVKGLTDDNEPLVVERRVDPNLSHTIRRAGILQKIGNELQGIKFSTHTFEAIAWQNKLKNNKQLCWKSDFGGEVRYSEEIIAYLKKLSQNEIRNALRVYP